MPSRSNRAFSLIEVLIAAGILAAAITLVLRSYTASLAAARLGQNISSACHLTENIIWEIEERYKDGYELPSSGEETIAGKKFSWLCEVSQTGIDKLDALKFTVWWQEGTREKPYKIEFLTYLRPKK